MDGGNLAPHSVRHNTFQVIAPVPSGVRYAPSTECQVALIIIPITSSVTITYYYYYGLGPGQLLSRNQFCRLLKLGILMTSGFRVPGLGFRVI